MTQPRSSSASLPAAEQRVSNARDRVAADIMRTGENGVAFMFGRNEDAFTFSRFCAAGDSGLATGFAFPFVADAGPAAGCTCSCGGAAADTRLPLNGGIG